MIKPSPERIKYLGFNDYSLILFALPVIGFIMPLVFFDTAVTDELFIRKWVISTMYATCYWIPLCWVMILLRKRYRNIEDVKKRNILQVIFAILCVSALTPILHFGFRFIEVNFFGLRPDQHPSLAQSLGGTFMVTFLALASYESVYFYHQLKESILEKESVKQAHIRSQWEGLRNQVNPHFLFNSLNTLMNIVAEDPPLAQRFLSQMSKVYRYILESREDPLIMLNEELKFMEAYVFLIQERFKGKLEVEMDIPANWHTTFILPLSLQILFENAIKHNVISKNRPLKIEVFVNDEDKLVVRNNLQRKNQVMHSTKVGLENIRTRYQLFTTDTVDVEESDLYFSVSLPLLSENQQHIHETPHY